MRSGYRQETSLLKQTKTECGNTPCWRGYLFGTVKTLEIDVQLYSMNAMWVLYFGNILIKMH